MKRNLRTILAAVCLAALPAALSAHTLAYSKGSNMRMDFTDYDTSQPWRAVNDGVMGGKSSGGPRLENGHMVFEGVINTNGGGFSSVRTNMQPGALQSASKIRLRVRSDGRAYKLTFRTDARKGWRQVSFQAPLPLTPPGEWAEITIPLTGLRASVFGRPLRGYTFDPAMAEEMGIIIADGQDGPFRLDVDWMVAE